MRTISLIKVYLKLIFYPNMPSSIFSTLHFLFQMLRIFAFKQLLHNSCIGPCLKAQVFANISSVHFLEKFKELFMDFCTLKGSSSINQHSTHNLMLPVFIEFSNLKQQLRVKWVLGRSREYAHCLKDYKIVVYTKEANMIRRWKKKN